MGGIRYEEHIGIAFERIDLTPCPCGMEIEDDIASVCLEAEVHGNDIRLPAIDHAQVDDGRCGVIVPQRSVEALAESIDGLLSDEKRLRALYREAYLKSCGNELQVICGKWRELLR